MGITRGRFRKAADESVIGYTASLPFDWRLYRYDIAGSIAHARMLARQGIISDREAKVIVDGLKSIEKEIEAGAFQFNNELEDIHMSIEDRLLEKAGKAGDLKQAADLLATMRVGLEELRRALEC